MTDHNTSHQVTDRTSNRRFDLFISYSRADNEEIKIDIDGEKIGWVEAFVKRLEARHKDFTKNDLRVFFDRKDILDDEYWVDKLRAGVRDSILFLAFLSPNYLKSDFCRREWEEYLRYQHGNARGEHGIKQLYVATIDELEQRQDPADTDLHAQIIKHLRGLQRNPDVDIRDVRKNPEALEQVLTQLDAKKRLDALKPDTKSRLFSFRKRLEKLDTDISQRLDNVRMADIAEQYSSMQISLNTFVGRSRELRDLHAAATNDKYGVVGAVHGLGGQGKTALTIQYAHAYAGFYAAGGRWFIPCEGVQSLAAALDQLSSIIPGIPGHELDDEQQKLPDAQRIQAHLQILRAAMKRRSDAIKKQWYKKYGADTNSPDIQQRCLIVLDNVDQTGFLDASAIENLSGLGDWLGVIATTRLDPHSLGASKSLKPVVIEDLPVDDRIALLQEFRTIPSRLLPMARELVEIVGGMTVLVEIMAATIAGEEKLFPNRTLEETLKTNIDDLKNSGIFSLDLLSDDVAHELRAKERQRRLDYIVEDTLASLIEPVNGQPPLAPEARSLLEFATCFPPDRVIEPWLQELVAQEHTHLSDDRKWARLMRLIDGRRLLLRAKKQGSGLAAGRLHRDIGAHIANSMTIERLESVNEQMITLLEKKAEPFWSVDISYNSELQSIREALSSSALYVLQKKRSVNLVKILSKTIEDEGNHGSLARAIELSEAVIKIVVVPDFLSDNDQVVIILRSLLGYFYLVRGAEGDTNRALVLYRKSLQAREQIYEQNPGSAQALHDLSVAQNNLGDFYRARGADDEQVLELYRQCVEGLELIYNDNPDSTQALRDLSAAQINLGHFYRERGAEGDTGQALKLYRHSLEAAEKIYKDNPDSTQALRDLSIFQSHLGYFYHLRGAEGDARRALELYRHSLEAAQKIYKDNPDSTQALRDLSAAQINLGDLYHARGAEGDTGRALELYRQGLKIREQIYEQESGSAQALQEVSTTQNKLGDLYHARGGEGDAGRALELYSMSVEGLELIYKYNPGSAQALRNLSVAQNNLGDLYHARRGEGDAGRTIELFRQHLETAEKIYELNPGGAQDLGYLSSSYIKLANIYLAVGSKTELERILNLYAEGLRLREIFNITNRELKTATIDLQSLRSKIADVLLGRGFADLGYKLENTVTNNIRSIDLIIQPEQFMHRKMRGAFYWLFNRRLLNNCLILTISLTPIVFILPLYSFWLLLISVPMGFLTISMYKKMFRYYKSYWKNRRVDTTKIEQLIDDIETGKFSAPD